LTAKANTTPVTLVVRRGALRRFDRLKQATRELPADVIWDRRQTRGGADGSEPAPPTVNRRKATPPTWDLADFAVVESPSPTPKSRGSRKKS
jgi:hypothetical protein